MHTRGIRVWLLLAVCGQGVAWQQAPSNADILQVVRVCAVVRRAQPSIGTPPFARVGRHVQAATGPRPTRRKQTESAHCTMSRLAMRLPSGNAATRRVIAKPYLAEIVPDACSSWFPGIWVERDVIRGCGVFGRAEVSHISFPSLAGVAVGVVRACGDHRRRHWCAIPRRSCDQFAGFPAAPPLAHGGVL